MSAVDVGTPVAQNDLMNTDVQGRTNLRFLDQSILDIGPGSDVRIDRFVYNPDRTTAGATISLVKGVMRYDSRGAPGVAANEHPWHPGLSRKEMSAPERHAPRGPTVDLRRGLVSFGGLGD